MEQTPNYALSQWDEQDRILREDFNANNAKVEQALAEQADTLAQHTAALALCGNCRVVYGSYIGAGTYGSSNPNKLTFDQKPVLVFVGQSSSMSGNDVKLRMMRGVPEASGKEDNTYWTNYVSWTDNGVQWYNTDGTSTQFNTSSKQYPYVAFLVADE